MRIKVLPSTFEVSRGILRRTPSLAQADGGTGSLLGRGWILEVVQDPGFYEAVSLYEALGLREPRAFLLRFDGEAWQAELLPFRPPPPRPREAPARKEEEVEREEKPRKRVRVGEEVGERAYRLLYPLLGEEEFSRHGGVDAYLASRGFDPEEVWAELEATGLLVREEGGFFRLRRARTRV